MRRLTCSSAKAEPSPVGPLRLRANACRQTLTLHQLSHHSLTARVGPGCPPSYRILGERGDRRRVAHDGRWRRRRPVFGVLFRPKPQCPPQCPPQRPPQCVALACVALACVARAWIGARGLVVAAVRCGGSLRPDRSAAANTASQVSAALGASQWPLTGQSVVTFAAPHCIVRLDRARRARKVGRLAGKESRHVVPRHTRYRVPRVPCSPVPPLVRWPSYRRRTDSFQLCSSCTLHVCRMQRCELPAMVEGIPPIASVAAGAMHTVAIRTRAPPHRRVSRRKCSDRCPSHVCVRLRMC